MLESALEDLPLHHAKDVHKKLLQSDEMLPNAATQKRVKDWLRAAKQTHGLESLLTGKKSKEKWCTSSMEDRMLTYRDVMPIFVPGKFVGCDIVYRACSYFNKLSGDR